MIPMNVLELALRDPGRRTADLAGHTRHAPYELHTAHPLRRTKRLITRHRPVTEH